MIVVLTRVSTTLYKSTFTLGMKRLKKWKPNYIAQDLAVREEGVQISNQIVKM